jgi:quercetin dioxygenase-like cupin family protein
MKHYLAAAVIIPVLVSCEPAEEGSLIVRVIDEGPEHHTVYQPEDIVWQEGPPSLPPGARFAVLDGDPNGPYVFTMRLRFPDGYHIPPHSHANVERITVISGTFHLGTGGNVDQTAATALQPGAYCSMQRGVVHYAIAEGETVVQINAVGPWIINYANPNDDPRRNE